MKLAISTDGQNVSAHFGRCPEFNIVDIDEGKVISKEVIQNPGHHPGYLPEFLSKKNVECIIAGGMGRKASELFDQYNIKQYTGVSGNINEIIQKLIMGKLVNNNSPCNPGSGRGYGIDKTECDHEGEE